MYAPEPFHNTDKKELINFIKDHPFGLLIQNGENVPYTTQIPFLVIEENDQVILEGHIAINNPQSKLLKKGKAALTVFTGPHGYVSSSVYTHKNVPTWNYQTVQAQGLINIMSDQELESHLEKMVALFENGRENPLDLASIPSELLLQYRKEIIGFQLILYKIDGIYKLSQNRNETDHARIVDDLSTCPANKELIEQMRRSKS